MRTHAAFTSLVVLTLACTGARDTGVQTHRSPAIDAIGRGDVAAVVAAEKSGDRSVVAALLATLRYGGADPQFRAAAKHALVALADRQLLQEIWCQAADESSLAPDVEPLGIVGGWFGIRGLQELLKPERARVWDRVVERRPNHGGDETYIGPDSRALLVLAESVSDPPVTLREMAGAGYPHTELINRWNDWIATHREDLKKLAPTGEGVDYSEGACKGGKPVRR